MIAGIVMYVIGLILLGYGVFKPKPYFMFDSWKAYAEHERPYFIFRMIGGGLLLAALLSMWIEKTWFY